MKKIFMGVFLLSNLFIYSQSFGAFASAVYLEKQGNSNFYNINGSGWHQISSQYFTNSLGLGTFDAGSGELLLQGAEVKSWNSSNSSVCKIDLKYLVYKKDNRPSVPTFQTINIPLYQPCISGSFGGGPCSPTNNDKKWQKANEGIDLTNYEAGEYTLEVYFVMEGKYVWESTCFKKEYLGAYGANYKTNFTIIGEPTPTAKHILNFDYDIAGNQILRNLVIIPLRRNTGTSDVYESTTFNSLENKIIIFPNPTDGIVNIKWEEELINQIYSVNVQNHNSFYSKNYEISVNQNTLTFDLSNQPSGLYYVKYLLKDGTTLFKIIQKN